MPRRAGRPQGRARGSTEQANALAEFVLSLTGGVTVRELAGRYHVGKTLWGEYRSGQKIIPLELLRRLVQDRTPDERTRRLRLETALRLHAAALEAGSATNPSPDRDPSPDAEPPRDAEPSPNLEPAPESAQVPAANPGAASTVRRRPRLTYVGGGVAVVLLAVLVLLVGWGPADVDGVASAPVAPEAGGAAMAVPSAGTGVYAAGPDGRGVFQWNGEDATGWTRIGDAAKRLWSGPAGLFATRTDDRLYRYEGRGGRWIPVSEPAADFAISGSHVYRLTADRQAVDIWDGRGRSWTRIGGPAVRLYGGAPGLFATSPNDGRIFRYLGRPGHWDPVGTAGASFALTGRHLYGLTPERAMVNRWLADEHQGPGLPWIYAAGPAGDLYGGVAGLFSTDLSGERLRFLTEPGADATSQNWRDIGSAGAEVWVGRREAYVLTRDRSEILRWSRDTGAWSRIGGPAQTLTVWATPE